MTEPQPIETAPLDDGWILAQVEDDERPWLICTRCDGGWCDDDGYDVTPLRWVPLPNPQPKPSGWLPPAGKIRVMEVSGDGWTDGNGKPVTVPWRWIIDIERPNGSYDEYRGCDMRETLEQAKSEAARWAQQFGLAVEVTPLPAPPSNVIQLDVRR